MREKVRQQDFSGKKYSRYLRLQIWWAGSEGETEGKQNEQRWVDENVQTGQLKSHRWPDTQKVKYEAVEEAETAWSQLSRTWLVMLL